MVEPLTLPWIWVGSLGTILMFLTVVPCLAVKPAPLTTKIGTISLSPRADWRMPSDADVEIWLRALED